MLSSCSKKYRFSCPGCCRPCTLYYYITIWTSYGSFLSNLEIIVALQDSLLRFTIPGRVQLYNGLLINLVPMILSKNFKQKDLIDRCIHSWDKNVLTWRKTHSLRRTYTENSVWSDTFKTQSLLEKNQLQWYLEEKQGTVLTKQNCLATGLVLVHQWYCRVRSQFLLAWQRGGVRQPGRPSARMELPATWALSSINSNSTRAFGGWGNHCKNCERCPVQCHSYFKDHYEC